MTILELREKRAKAWKPRKPFWIPTETTKASCPPRMTPPIPALEQEITDLGKEIARLERQEALEAELNRPVNKPLTGNP